MMNNRDKGGSVTGRWVRVGNEHLWDPHYRPWVSGRRPWQYKDRTKWIVFDEASDMTPKMWECDFAKIEERILAHQVNECQDLLARRRFEKALFLGLKNVESRTVYLNSLRMIP